jgi:predicted DNA-binding transcriptional regulator AlpA
MSVPTLAAYLDVGERIVEQWRTTGKLPPPVDLNGARLTRWRRADVDAFISGLSQEKNK